MNTNHQKFIIETTNSLWGCQWQGCGRKWEKPEEIKIFQGKITCYICLSVLEKQYGNSWTEDMRTIMNKESN